MMYCINARRFDDKQDYPMIYKVYSSMHEQYKLFDIVSLNSPEYFPKVFERTLSYGYQDFFVLEDDNKETIGFVISYDFKPNDGHIKILVYIEEKYRGVYGAIATIMFMDYIYTYYNVRKIYTEVYEYNTPSIRAHASLGFTEEARLSQYRYYRNKYWDYIYYSIKREDFYEKNDRLIQKFQVGKMFL